MLNRSAPASSDISVNYLCRAVACFSFVCDGVLTRIRFPEKEEKREKKTRKVKRIRRARTRFAVKYRRYIHFTQNLQGASI